MGYLPNILPAHPEAPEWMPYLPIKRPGSVAQALFRMKRKLKQNRDLRALRKVSNRTLMDLGLHKSGLRAAPEDRAELVSART